MKITLTDGYFVTVDNYNYILKQDYTFVTKKGEVKTCTRTVGYYSNGIKGLKGCLVRYLEDCTLDAQKSQEVPLKAFCEQIRADIDTKSEQILEHITDLVEK